MSKKIENLKFKQEVFKTLDPVSAVASREALKIIKRYIDNEITYELAEAGMMCIFNICEDYDSFNVRSSC